MGGKSVKYPVYVVSKGRYENPITAKYFLSENVDFYIVVEPQEYDLYCKSIPKKNVLKTNFKNLGLGSYPARNFAWEHSKNNGFKKHFLFDDNIYGFIKYNKGQRKYKKYNDPISAKDALNKLIIFSEQYKNIAVCGYNYDYFVTDSKKPFTYNTHVYSGMLIDNNLPFRWRLKYNEDVDLCLNALHNGYNSILLNAILILKVSTVAKLKGGNQTELYKGNSYDKKVLKVKMLQEVWPQYVQAVNRFGRPHHYVDWKKHFKQTLKRK